MSWKTSYKISNIISYENVNHIVARKKLTRRPVEFFTTEFEKETRPQHATNMYDSFVVSSVSAVNVGHLFNSLLSVELSSSKKASDVRISFCNRIETA